MSSPRSDAPLPDAVVDVGDLVLPACLSVCLSACLSACVIMLVLYYVTSLIKQFSLQCR
jgi:hypothetical protein